MKKLIKTIIFLTYLAVHLGGLLLASASRQSTKYLNSTAVLLSEVFKCIFSLLSIASARGSASAVWKAVYDAIFANPTQLLRVCLPALVYTIQNNLIYTALAHLDAVTFQITYQLKIVASLLCYRFLLKRAVSKIRWIAMALLAVGVALVQLSSQQDDEEDSSDKETTTKRNYTLGLIGVLVACLCSGVGGAVMELLLKDSGMTLPQRNLQVAFVSLLLASAHMLSADRQQIAVSGFFQGYTPQVWLMVLLDSCGGLLVSMLLKYTSTLLKNFASPLGIILNCLLSRYAFARSRNKLNMRFLLGTLLTLLALGMYSVSA